MFSKIKEYFIFFSFLSEFSVLVTFYKWKCLQNSSPCVYDGQGIRWFCLLTGLGQKQKMTALERMSVFASYVFFQCSVQGTFSLSLSPFESAVWPLAGIKSFSAGRWCMLTALPSRRLSQLLQTCYFYIMHFMFFNKKFQQGGRLYSELINIEYSALTIQTVKGKV